MVLSMFQFLATAFLVIICSRAIALGEGDVPVLAMLIPALWVLSERRIASTVLLAGMIAYGFTLPNQPASVSVSVWIIMPLLMVIFSKRSSIGVVWTAALIVVTLQIGLMVTQSSGKLGEVQ